MEAVAFRSAGDPSGRRVVPPELSGPGGDELARLYAQHSRPLLQLAVLLVHDIHAAREIVYEAFAALDSGRSRPRRSDDAFMLLLRTVVHQARRAVAAAPDCGAPAGLSVSQPDTAVPESAVLGALQALPRRQREALVLRYYGQLSDEQAATAMGVRPGEMRANVARGMAGLRAALTSSGCEPVQ